MRRFVARAVRTSKLLARDVRIPRALRWIAGVGLLPLPGPVDEALLLLVAPIFVFCYRDATREAWQEAGRQPSRSTARRT